MQINRLGVVLIAFFGLVGLGMVIVPIALGASAEAALILASTGGIWVLVALALAFYARHQKGKAAHQDWVFQNGIKGRATVVEASSHVTINEMPQMKLTLELDVPGQETRRVQCREVMSLFAANRLVPGLVLPVHVNPRDPGDFILVW